MVGKTGAYPVVGLRPSNWCELGLRPKSSTAAWVEPFTVAPSTLPVAGKTTAQPVVKPLVEPSALIKSPVALTISRPKEHCTKGLRGSK